MPRRVYREGLRELRRLMSTPDMSVDVSTGSSTTLDVSMSASFLPFDTVTVDAIGKNGRRLGRAVLSPEGAPPDFGRCCGC